MSATRKASLVVPAAARHTATVIFAHGLGDTGHGWRPIVENWRRRQRLDHVKFVLPHAPMKSITANMGMPMPGWFDIVELSGSIESLQRSEDERGILESRTYFHQLIQEEIDAGIPADRIVLGGFSQGGAMSIFAGLSASVKLAGIVGLSSWLLLGQQFKDRATEENKATPMLMCHGTMDPLVAPQLAQMSFQVLQGLGYDIKMKTYPIAHSACPEELDDVEEFLKERLP
ncbi:related to lysophospholipase [Cephalotrichum gorgonifer]|uniref:Acyl-protein thioesterase 1 n=1 Tax=Cephalotrichum gorgonifer TaxID=2041049 RepID=A0AAE8MUB1_9PEZI|nr:related to lysophospholipase [Cephalotrichum gorgonifer]